MTTSSEDKKLVNTDGSESLPEDRKSSQVSDKPKRRVFSPEYKLEILEKLEECKGKRGAVGELLRREGLYAAQVAKWRQDVEEGLAGSIAKKRGPKPNPAAKAQKEAERLARENERLKERLRQAELVIDAQKKLSEILGVSLPEHPDQSDVE
jgi:transposase-like protein